MLESRQAVGSFDVARADRLLDDVLPADRVFLTGEGSSRIFPAKHAVFRALSLNLRQQVHTEACYQAAELNLEGWKVFGASNSGQTRELLFLFEKLKRANIPTIAVCANRGTPLEKAADSTFWLGCGPEKATPATKVVVEEALFFDHLIHRMAGRSIKPYLSILSKLSQNALEADIDPEIVKMGANASRIFFSGRNDGMSEELTIKSLEIARKPSVYLEGTNALHGIEEVLTPEDLIVLVEPFEREEAQFDRVLRKGVGVRIVAISSRKTRFPTIPIPAEQEVACYLQLMTGWNYLVQIGLMLGHNLDKPRRARKVGNPT